MYFDTLEKGKVALEKNGITIPFPQQDIYAVTLYFIQPDDYYQKLFTKNELKEVENKLLHTINKIKQYYPYTDKNLNVS